LLVPVDNQVGMKLRLPCERISTENNVVKIIGDFYKDNDSLLATEKVDFL